MTKSQRDTSRGENELLVPKKAEKKFGYFSALHGQFLDLPLSDAYRSKRDTYTKEEVDNLIKHAIDEARRIDEESMAKHNRDATVISMILDIDILERIAERVETSVIDKVKQVPIQRILQSGFR